MSGFTNLTGETGGAPLHMNYPMGDMVAGCSARSRLPAPSPSVAGLNEAMPGQEIDLAATEALFRLLEPAVEYEQLGQVRQRAGNRTYTAPSNMYATADGQWVSLVASSGPIFRRLCRAIGRPGMADDRFATNPSQVRHLDALDEVVAGWFGSHAYADVASPRGARDSVQQDFLDRRYRRRSTFRNGRRSSGCPIGPGVDPGTCVVPGSRTHPPPARSGPGSASTMRKSTARWD
jgi:crotonobetainyl-CoA:carnitine CoA-transferase CaiB-like acyl-CoA transferase